MRRHSLPWPWVCIGGALKFSSISYPSKVFQLTDLAEKCFFGYFGRTKNAAPKGTILGQTASFGPPCLQVGPVVWSVEPIEKREKVSRASAAALSTVLWTTSLSYTGICDFQDSIERKPLDRSTQTFARNLMTLTRSSNEPEIITSGWLKAVLQIGEIYAAVTFPCMQTLYFISRMVLRTRPLYRFARTMAETTRFGRRKCLLEGRDFTKFRLGVLNPHRLLCSPNARFANQISFCD